MPNLNDLRAERIKVIDKMEEILEEVEDEERDFTDAEDQKYTRLEKQLRKIDLQIDQARTSGDRSDLRRIVTPIPRIEIGGGQEGDFRNFGEFLHVMRTDPHDSRLVELRAQVMKDGTSGGYAVPAQFAPLFLMAEAAPGVVRPRATVIPAGDSPDAEISIPALDQRTSSGANHMFGGVTIARAGEASQITETDFELRQVKLTPKPLNGFINISNKLLNNWDAASIVVPRMLSGALSAQEDQDFLSGDGVNKAIGVMNSAARVNVARAAANQISWADVLGMLGRLRAVGGQPVWIASQTTLPQLAQIQDASSRAIWQADGAAGLPPTLYGYPVLWHDRSPALGSAGDLMLADLSGYLIKNGSGPTLAISEHFRFQNDETAFRIVQYVDGQSWLTEPLALEGSTSNTVSPFVVLN